MTRWEEICPLNLYGLLARWGSLIAHYYPRPLFFKCYMLVQSIIYLLSGGGF